MRATRITYVGELGWELYVPMEQGARVWDLLHEAGRPDGAVPVGIGVYGTTGRLEKCYRGWKVDLEIGFSPFDASLDRFVDLHKSDFVGRDALLADLATERGALSADGRAAVDRVPPGRRTSRCTGPGPRRS